MYSWVSVPEAIIIDLSHISNNAPVLYNTQFCYKVVYCGYLSDWFWDLWDESITYGFLPILVKWHEGGIKRRLQMTTKPLNYAFIPVVLKFSAKLIY